MLRATLQLWFVVLSIGVIVSGCYSNQPTPASSTIANTNRSVTSTENRTPQEKSPKFKPKIVPQFVDVAPELGINFTFYNDAVAGRYFLPEVMGGGAGWIDFDLDGRFDLCVRDGCNLKSPDTDVAEHYTHLFRNIGSRFVDVTAFAKIGYHGYGQGCAVGDFDSDGFPDLFFANFGANALFRNMGDGTFENVTEMAAVADPQWASSAAWFDANADGLLDLYVVNYMNVSFDNYKICHYDNKPGYCGPGDYSGVDDLVYINQGDGRFVESAESLGFKAENGKGLAMSILDFDGDLLPEVYVANDMTANFLFTRGAQGSTSPANPAIETKAETAASAKLFREVAVIAGCATADNGQNEASMGISTGDFDGDGLPDIFLTHFYQQKNTLYRNLGHLAFVDDSRRSRSAATSFDFLGFGTVAFDYNGDGALDLFIANGHVLGPEHQPNEMHPQLMENDGKGRFFDVLEFAGEYFQRLLLGRCAAAGDFDNDGDVDIFVTHLDKPVALLENRTDTGRQFIGFELITMNRIPAVGGRVVVTVGGKKTYRPVMAGGSYLASPDPRITLSLMGASSAEKVEIFWPSGRVDVLENVSGGRYLRIIEGAE